MRINKIMDGMLAFRTGFVYSHGADKAQSASVRPTTPDAAHPES